jgi:hypothetical protein
MGLGLSTQNEAYRALIPELGLKLPHKPKSLTSFWDMDIIERFCVPCMGLMALIIIDIGK